MTFYITGTINARTPREAETMAKSSGELAICRGTVVNFLDRKPRQPGQAEFRTRPEDKVYGLTSASRSVSS